MTCLRSSLFPPSCLLALLTWVLLIGGTATWRPAKAQMFGPRSLGRTLRPQPSPGISGSVGTLRNQRFIRGNRQRSDFVGTDRLDARQFVGMQQTGAAGEVRSAVAGAADGDESLQVNQPRRRPAARRPYDPPLEVGFPFAPLPASDVAAQINRQFASRWPGLEVWVVDRTAILRGVVASADDRQLAELMVSFEPGVSRVRNELRVARDTEAIPPPLPQTD